MIINLAMTRDSSDLSVKVAIKDTIFTGIQERKFENMKEAIKYVLEREFTHPPHIHKPIGNDAA